MSTPDDVMAPLRARYAHWLGMDQDQVLQDRDEAAEDVRALQLVLRMEKATPPSWHTALGLAASATALVCLDPRATDPDGEWHAAIADYTTGHIRKVTRRARGAQWEAVQDLPGVTLGDGDTQVRALLPGRVVDLDKRVTKLQVGGTDAPVDDQPTIDDDPGVLQMWLPPEPVMTLGKSMAQAGHAAMIGAALLAASPGGPDVLTHWVELGCPAVGIRTTAATWATLADQLTQPDEAWRRARLLGVRDAGFTEIEAGTITVIARAPGPV
ncbi:peptidyl-tRNA hydrolase [Microlunatus sp. Y2014]|uniref:peptidyl-tRNA hydrolase n=1 Tax=Microlunatus sp. Y2014 TaxID=3418488 RepID=UPI003DA70770